MNFSLAREIYGNTPWLVDAYSFHSLFNILKDFRSGVNFSNGKSEKLNNIYAFETNSAQLIRREWQLKNAEQDAEIISVINLNGAITKGGGESSYGTKELSNRMSVMTKDKRVKGHIIVADSGGGSTAAIRFLADSIKESQEAGKPVVTMIEKGGLCASACYAIASYSDYIYSESVDNMVGSIGTMIEFAGVPKEHTDSDGFVYVRAYATKSIHKNESFEEAIKGNLKPITNELLDPVNERFIKMVKLNRPNVKEEQLTGKVYEAEKVIGTLIDGIGNIQNAIDKVFELSKTERQAQVPEINNKHKSKTMTVEELKQNHPTTYQSIFDAGVSAEKDRCGAWMAHSATDIKAVKEGIESGEVISQTKREEFLVKAASLNHLENIKNDSPDDVKTPQTKEEAKPKSEAETEAEDFYAKIDKQLKK